MEQFTYRYRWENASRLIVTEYYRGRYIREYTGEVKDNGNSVDLTPMKGRQSYDPDVPCEAKRIMAREMIREERKTQPSPVPTEVYDSEAWNYQEGKLLEGVQLSLV